MLVHLVPRTLYIQATHALGVLSRHFTIDLYLAMTSSAGELFCIFDDLFYVLA